MLPLQFTPTRFPNLSLFCPSFCIAPRHLFFNHQRRVPCFLHCTQTSLLQPPKEVSLVFCIAPRHLFFNHQKTCPLFSALHPDISSLTTKRGVPCFLHCTQTSLLQPPKEVSLVFCIAPRHLFFNHQKRCPLFSALHPDISSSTTKRRVPCFLHCTQTSLL